MTEKELNKLIGKNIRKYRLIYNAYNNSRLTQAKLGKELGVAASLITALENDKSDLGISTYNLYRISKVLNVPIEKFFEEE